MNTGESTYLLKRMASTWPGAGKLDDAAFAEWTDFLASYEPGPAWGALRALRETCTWRPSMADFRTAYFQALALADEERKQLPAGPSEGSETDSLRDRYGTEQDRWIYCWRCDMAISLKDMERNRGYDIARGLYHRTCPRRGSAPQIPLVQKAEREKWLLDHKISIGPNVEPVPYVEVPRRARQQAQDFNEVSRIASEYLARQGNRTGRTP